MRDRFASTLRRQEEALWAAIHDHPFVRGLGDGSLSAQRFAYYLRQDYGYLVTYARVMALAAGASDRLEDVRFFADQLALTLDEEMALHRKVSADYGLDETALLATPPHAVPVHYGRHLEATAREGDVGAILAALLPCGAGYVEIAHALRARGLPDVPAYRRWIEVYTSEGMEALARWLTTRLDRAAESADEATRARWRDGYHRSAAFERAFFEMAWTLGESGLPNGTPDPRTWRLYVVTDDVDVARDAVAGGADAIQLRDKRRDGGALVEVARRLRRITRDAGVPLIANDRVDVALAADADGVHVGSSDLSATDARRLIGPDRILGVSARNVDEALEADRGAPDYIGFGPVFDARATKSDAGDPAGVEALREACRRCHAPIIAIGGITAESAPRLREAGAAGVAIVSAVADAPDREAATRDLRRRVASDPPFG